MLMVLPVIKNLKLLQFIDLRNPNTYVAKLINPTLFQLYFNFTNFLRDQFHLQLYVINTISHIFHNIIETISSIPKREENPHLHSPQTQNPNRLIVNVSPTLIFFLPYLVLHEQKRKKKKYPNTHSISIDYACNRALPINENRIRGEESIRQY